MSAVWQHDQNEHITSKMLVDLLQDAVIAVGDDSVGFKVSQVGTHSIWSNTIEKQHGQSHDLDSHDRLGNHLFHHVWW